LHLRVLPLRFSFQAREPIHFPNGKSSNILRGAFGTIFRRLACIPQCTEVSHCELRSSCPYARIFEPTNVAHGPSGLSDWPRPFVFRATHLDGCTIAPGASFSFDLNLFDPVGPAVAFLAMAFKELAWEGIGPRRGKAELLAVSLRDEADRIAVELFDGHTLFETRLLPLQLNLEPMVLNVKRAHLAFVTPTEIKSGQQVPARPDFGPLASRIRDRISTLRNLYGEGPLQIDFRAFGDRAAQVRLVRWTARKVDVIRQSSRTGLIHPIGGFIGDAEYEGNLTEFMPYLHAAKWTGVGRQTVWGKGELAVLSYA
jgi:hypothetical protein